MGLIITLDVIAVGWLCATVFRKGFEGALPLTAFLLLLFPNQSQFHVPGLFDFTTQRIVIIALIGLYLVKGRVENEEAPKRPLPLKYLIIFVMVWMLVSSANSVVPDVSIKSTLSQFFDYFVPFYICAKAISKIETIHEILFGFVASLFVCSVFGYVEAYTGWSVQSLFPYLPSRFSYLEGGIADRGIRAASTFSHPILFGAALAMGIPMALYLLTLATTRARQIFLWLAILLMVLCIYKTDSRGPWVALALSLAALLALGKGQMRKYLTVIALLTATVLVVRPGVWDTISNLYGATLDPDSSEGQSYQWRYVLLDVAKRELAKDTGRGLWGYGPESFFYLGLTTQAQVDGEEHTVKVDSCDSAVVELMMDTGYVGFLLVAILLIKAALVAFSSYRRTVSEIKCLPLVLCLNICAFCFLMMSVEIFGWGQQTYMLWIVIALTMTYRGLQLRENTFGPAASGEQDITLAVPVEAGAF